MILLISPKQVYATRRFMEEAEKAGVALEVLDVRDLSGRNFKIDASRYGLLFIRSAYPYFKEVTLLAKEFLAAGKPVVDEAVAKGDVGLGKMAGYEALQSANIPVPKTCWLKSARAEEIRFPSIAKWNFGFGGKGLFLLKGPADVEKALRKYRKEEMLLQEFIRAEFEYKVITVAYKAVPYVLRFCMSPATSRPDFKKFQVLGLNECADPVLSEVVSLAEKSAFALKREMSKVDILQADNRLYVLEANRWPGLKSFEQLTGANIAGCFLDYLKQKVSEQNTVKA